MSFLRSYNRQTQAEIPQTVVFHCIVVSLRQSDHSRILYDWFDHLDRLISAMVMGYEEDKRLYSPMISYHRDETARFPDVRYSNTLEKNE